MCPKTIKKITKYRAMVIKSTMEIKLKHKKYSTNSNNGQKKVEGQKRTENKEIRDISNSINNHTEQ